MRKLFLLVLASGLLGGCGITQPMRKSETRLSMLTVGESKSNVQSVLGLADRVRASRRLDNGSIFELHEYKIYGRYKALGNTLACPITLFVSCFWADGFIDPSLYWLQYVDGKLDRWGRSGDWQPNLTSDITIHQR